MSPATMKLWQVIEREFGSGGNVSLSHEAILAAVGGTWPDAVQALNELLQYGDVKAVTDEELQQLGEGKAAHGRFVTWHGPTGIVGGSFRVNQFPAEQRRSLLKLQGMMRAQFERIRAESAAKNAALSAKRELLRRQIQRQQPELAKKIVDAEAAIRKEVSVQAALKKLDANVQSLKNWLVANKNRCVTPGGLYLNDDEAFLLQCAVEKEFGPRVEDIIAANRPPNTTMVDMTSDYGAGFRGLTEPDMRTRLKVMESEASQRGGDPLFGVLLFSMSFWKYSRVLAQHEQNVASNESRLSAAWSQLSAAEAEFSAAMAKAFPDYPVEAAAIAEPLASFELFKKKIGFERSESMLAYLPAEPQYKRESIPENVRNEVWRRDQGRCVKCGSQERLHFDHIIPVSKGGANTARNLQLLCEKCNLAKSDKI